MKRTFIIPAVDVVNLHVEMVVVSGGGANPSSGFDFIDGIDDIDW